MTVLVSGRMLADIRALPPAPDLFDAIVAESGAVVQMANAASPTVLARGPDALVAELERRNVPHRSGFCDEHSAPCVEGSHYTVQARSFVALVALRDGHPVLEHASRAGDGDRSRVRAREGSGARPTAGAR